jgi:aquaporin NIP
MRALAAEFTGTFFLVFAGTGAIVFNATQGGVIGHVGIALTFGLVVMVMIVTFGDVSGAHLNPAVSLGFAISGRFPWQKLPGYVGAQIAGACAASLVLKVLVPASETLGATVPAGSAGQSFLLECLLTGMLMYTVLSVSDGSKEKGIMASVVIGGLIALEALFAGPISGASMNPARSIGPAVVSGSLQYLWIYLAAPVLGALLAVPWCRLIRQNPCCCSS